MQSSYITFLKVCEHHKIPKSDWKLNGKYNYIQFTNGSRIDLIDLAWKPSDPLFERFGSLEYTGGWIEEGGEVIFDAFDILKTRIGRFQNDKYDLFPAKLLITCNPKKNWLYSTFYRPFRDGELAQEYSFIQSLWNENPYTAKEYGKQLSKITDEAKKQRLKYGNWEYDDDPATLIDYDAIVDLFTNTVEPSNDKYLSVDVARFGKDKMVVKLWRGFAIEKIIVWEKQGLDISEEKLKQIIMEERIPYSHVVIDEDGVGGGLVDNMKGVRGFVNNSSPLLNPVTKEKENYRNLKSQCAYLLAEKINNREIAIDKGVTSEKQREEIIEELEQVKGKDVEKDSKLEIISKDIVKDLIGRSPDYSDTMLMRMIFTLEKPKRTVVAVTYRPNYKGIYKR